MLSSARHRSCSPREDDSRRDRRHDFGVSLFPQKCEGCKSISVNRGCLECNLIFCKACYGYHDASAHGNVRLMGNNNRTDFNEVVNKKVSHLEQELKALELENQKLRERIRELEVTKSPGKFEINNIEHPNFGDELQALPGAELNLGGTDYYKAGDRGRISKERCDDSFTKEGIKCFEVTWYRTGLTTTLQSSTWLKNFRFICKGRHPCLGDEMKVLPGVSFKLDGVDHYSPGDLGRVSRGKYADSGYDKFEVTWYRTGKTSIIESTCWPMNFLYSPLPESDEVHTNRRFSNLTFRDMDINQDGVITEDEFRAALSSVKSEESAKLVPVSGDEMRALPNVELVVDGEEYYKGGDKGRVTKDEYKCEKDGIRRFEVTWYRTGRISTMVTSAWLNHFQFLGKGNNPTMGDEVMCLPNVELNIKGKEYYRSGDKGRVSKDNYVDAQDNIERFEVTWYRTGLTSTMKVAMWFRNFRLLDTTAENKTIEELKQELSAMREKMICGGSNDISGVTKKYPEVGDEMQVLPGIKLISSGIEYYVEHDKGRVSRERYVDENDNIEKFQVTWYRTGRTSTMKSHAWLKNFRFVGTPAKLPTMGHEVQCLPRSKLVVDDVEYYKGGDRGRVSKDQYVDKNDGIDRFEVTWYRTGRTSTMRCDAWLQHFMIVVEDTVLIDEQQKLIMRDAVDGSDVLEGKPVDMITGQPRSAAMGLYHFMRVKDPFAESGTSKMEDEIEKFVMKLKSHAVLDRLLQTATSEYNEILSVYGESRITEAREEIAYFRTAARLPESASALEVAQKVEQELLDNLKYILYETTSEKWIDGPNAWRDRGRVGKRFESFMEHPNVRDAELTRSHVAALRLYTSPAYKYMNSPLRSQADYYDKEKEHPLPVTVAHIAEGIKKLRAAYAVKVESKQTTAKLTLWRGMRYMNMAADFMKNRRGGTELAPMSTTSDLMVASKYAASGDSILYKIQLDNFMQYGAELSWLSFFPGEEEVLYPPLTYLQPTSREPQVLELGTGHKFTIYEVKPTIP